jgi:hypothetical protein
MNTRCKISFNILVWLVFALPAKQACAAQEEFDFRLALPDKKAALPVSLRRNPFQISGDRDRPLAILRDKDDPAGKLPALLIPHIRSVFRQPKPLLLVDSTVVQPGDEIHFAKNEALEKFRIVLRSIESDRLVFHLTAIDSLQGDQIECLVPLPSDMRKDK